MRRNAEKYKKPPIPEKYSYVLGEWNTGFVIQRNCDGSQFVWIPVGYLKANGTLKAMNDEAYNQKFGRRNYFPNDILQDIRTGYCEYLLTELKLQKKSVKKYGGFYISRYKISKNEEGTNVQSVKGAIPLKRANYYYAIKVAENFERGDKVKSHLTYGAEHDSMVEWFIESGAMYREEIERHPIKKCNQKKSKKIARTGSKKTVQINNICDLPVEDTEWTQESIVSNRFGGMYQGGCQVQRGGNSIYNSKNSIAYRTRVIPVDVCENTGFRIVLCLK